MDKVLSLNIRLANKLLQENVLTPIDLTKACLERAQATKKYNAFITLTEDQAKRQAEESTKRFNEKNMLSDIDGLSVAVKDNFCTQNVRTTCASKMLENFLPKYNATVYEKLRNAGAILLGKTNLDQFAMGSGTIDSIYGPTKNIWGYSENSKDFSITGGSSGGSAIAVATGACYAGIGSDTGGSTRNPASYCGLVGLKPTYGLVSRFGLIPLVNSMDVPAILARSVDDCVSILNIVAGHDPKDSTSLTKSYSKIRYIRG